MLGPILSTRTIDWDLIAQQCDEMLKCATALRPGTAEALQSCGMNKAGHQVDD